MKFKFELYCADCETTSLKEDGEIIELSLYRLSDDSQKTWCIKPINYESIESEALRVNGHKIEDLKHQTKFGVETYMDAKQVMVEIENWMAEDLSSSKDRVLIGQNIIFDLKFMERLWKKHDSYDTFPFSDRPLLLDTRQLALFLDLANNDRSEFYNLGSLVQKYGVKKEKAHAAASDTRMTKNVFLAQLNSVQKLCDK